MALVARDVDDPIKVGASRDRELVLSHILAERNPSFLLGRLGGTNRRRNRPCCRSYSLLLLFAFAEGACCLLCLLHSRLCLLCGMPRLDRGFARGIPCLL